MSRKTLKQKLKSQLRNANAAIKTHHHLAGLTINFECQRLQAIALAHGIMATLLDVKSKMDVESDAFKDVEKTAQGRIAQCVVQLVGMGMTHEEANKRIMAGH